MTLNVSRDFLLLMAGRGAQVLLSLISLRIATTLLSVEQFGIFALLNGFRAFFGLLFINPVGQHINRHTHEWFDDGSLRARLYRYNIYISLVAISAIIIVAIWAFLRETLTFESGWLAALAMGLAVYLGTWNGTLISMLNMVGFRGLSVGFEILTAFIILVGSVFLVLENDSGVHWFAGAVFGLGIVSVMVWQTLKRKLPYSAEVPKTVELLDRDTIYSYCFPLATATGCMWLLNSGYRYPVESGWGSAALGFMAVGLGIASQMWSIFETLAMQFLFPHFYKAISVGNHAEQKQAYTDLINTLIPLYLIFLGFTLTTGGWALALLTNVKFHDAYPYVFFGAIIEYCRVMAGLLSQAAQVTKLTSYNIIPYAFAGAFATIACVVVDILNAPLMMVAAALVIAGVILVISMAWQMNKVIPILIDWGNLGFAGIVAIGLLSAAIIIGIGPKPIIKSFMALGLIGILSISAALIYLRECAAYQALISFRLR